MSFEFPPGWDYEPDDPSVGIFGIGVFHEDHDPADYEQTGAVWTGVGANRSVTISYVARCPCGATATFTETSGDPDYGEH